MRGYSAPSPGKQLAVFDASPLVFFDVLGYTDLLFELHRVLAPPAVVEELVVLPGESSSRLSAREWFKRRAPDRETLRRVESEFTEGKGEKETIALALDLSALVVLDGKRARSYAGRVGLRSR